MPECYADTLLIQTLVPPKTASGYNHKHSCNEVAKEMITGKLKDSFAVGIIDNDKKVIPYLSEFEIIGTCESGLLLWKHGTKHHYIIQINPALEKWILDVCAKASINIKNYELDNTLVGLKKHTKSVASIKDKKLINLFDAIKDKSAQVAPVNKLIAWVSMLRDENYEIDINELKNV